MQMTETSDIWDMFFTSALLRVNISDQNTTGILIKFSSLIK